jgi:hypothetical protein
MGWVGNQNAFPLRGLFTLELFFRVVAPVSQQLEPSRKFGSSSYYTLV